MENISAAQLLILCRLFDVSLNYVEWLSSVDMGSKKTDKFFQSKGNLNRHSVAEYVASKRHVTYQEVLAFFDAFPQHVTFFDGQLLLSRAAVKIVEAERSYNRRKNENEYED